MLEELGGSRYVSLTTFRKDGVGVDTPVWCVTDGTELLIWTDADSWKVRRLRGDTRVRLTACTVRGRIAPGAPQADGSARIVEDEQGLARIRLLLARKYRWQFWLVDRPAALLGRGRRAHVGIAVTV